MKDSADLYQKIILEHSENPRNHIILKKYTHFAVKNNPLCGDTCDVYVQLNENTLDMISCTAVGCILCKSSGSLMTEIVKGCTVEESQKIVDTLHSLLLEDAPPSGMDFHCPRMGRCRTRHGCRKCGHICHIKNKIGILLEVKKYPIRIPCVLLPWQALQLALSTSKNVAKI